MSNLPTTAWLVLNYACNNHCLWCYTAFQHADINRPEMTLNLARSVQEELSKIGTKSCTLIGGEPTLHSSLVAIIKHGKDLGLRMWVITNGRLLAKPPIAADCANARLDGLTISIEGPDAVTHDIVTGVKGSFKQTVLGIRNCIAAGLRVKTLTTISKENIDHAERIIDTLMALGIKRCLFNVCTPGANGTGEFSPALKETVTKLRLLYEYANERVNIDRITTSLPLCLFDRDEPLVKEGIVSGKCVVFHAKGLVVDTDGSLLLCTHSVGVPIGCIARAGKSIGANEIIHLWNEGNPAKVRQRLWASKPKKCNGCELWGENCTGGCLFLRPSFDLRREVRSAKSCQN